MYCIAMNCRWSKQHLQRVHTFLTQIEYVGYKQIRHSSTQKKSHSEYCRDLVRRCDYENFLCSLLLPDEARNAAFAVRAFNVEVAQIRDIVTDKNIGLMRLKFWQETVDSIFKEAPPATPIAIEVAKAVKKHKLSKRWFSRILQTRELDMNRNAYESIEDVEDYAENTVSSINYLLLESQGVKNVQADHAASHIGKAQGLVTLLRGTPFHANKRQVYLPTDLIIKHQVSHEDILRGSTEQNMKDIAFEIASAANQHLEKARSLKRDVPKEAMQTFLYTASCDSYLKNLQRTDFNVFDGRLQQRNYLLPLKIWMNKLTKTY